MLFTREPYAFASGDPLTFGDPSGTAALMTGGRVGFGEGGDPLFDALGFPSTSGALCEQLDQAQADLPAVLSNLETTLKGGGRSTLVTKLLRAAAEQQPNWDLVTASLHRLTMSDAERSVQAYAEGVRRAIDAAGPVDDETLSLVRQGITDFLDPSRQINWEWVLRQGMH